MDPKAAETFLRAYQVWRKAGGGPDPAAAGFHPGKVSTALDALLADRTSLTATLASTQAQLARCRVQREKFHAQLRSKRAG